MKKIPLFVAGLLVTTALRGVSAEATRFDYSKFHIGALSFKSKFCDDAHLKDIVDCGLDNIEGKLTAKDAELCAKYGLMVRIPGPIQSFWGPNIYGRHGKVPAHGGVDALEKKIPFSKYEKSAEQYHPVPNEWTFSIGDEMSSREFAYLGRVVNLFREKHPELEPHINHHPCWQQGARVEWHLGTNYVDMIREYCRLVPTDYISYDFYLYEYGLKHKDPKDAKRNEYTRDYGTARYLDNLRIVADACRDYGRMFDFIAGVNAQQDGFRVTEPMIRYQAYTAMAFGVQKLFWACWAPGWWFRNVLDKEGNKTEQYERLKKVNLELRAFCDEYIRYRRVNTKFTGFTGRAAKWIAPYDTTYYPQVNFNEPSPLTTGFFFDIAAEDELPLIVSDFEPRIPDRSRAIFICSADDPWDEHQVERTIHFRTPRKVRVFDGTGEVACPRGKDGRYTVKIRSNSGAFIIGR